MSTGISLTIAPQPDTIVAGDQRLEINLLQRKRCELPAIKAAQCGNIAVECVGNIHAYRLVAAYGNIDIDIDASPKQDRCAQSDG